MDAQPYPAPHRRTAERLAAQSHVPILVDGGLVNEAQVIQGSDAIIDHLERWPERRLTPLDTLPASLAAEWERYLDAEIGVSIRCWFYYYVLPERALATRFLLQGAPWYGRPLYALMLRHAMRQMMHIDAGNAARSEARLRAASATDLVHNCARRACGSGSELRP